jgi:hypothetical protein
MTAAQKAAKEKFKKAIEYRTKTGVSLKEAFAHVYGKKVGAIKKKAAPKKKSAPKKVVAKKAAPKKAAAKKIATSHKDTKSHNVNIRVVSGVDAIRNKTMKEIEETKKIILDQSELLERLQAAYKKSKSKVNKENLMYDIKTLKLSFIPHNKRYLKALQSTLKKSI